MIDQIITALTATSIAARKAGADPVSGDDAVPIVRALIDTVTNNNTYPLKLPNDIDPAEFGIYQLAGWRTVEVEGQVIGRTETWLVSLRSNSFDTLRAMSDQFVAAIDGYSGTEGVEITDAATDYEFEQRQFRAHFELQITLMAGAQSARAAFVNADGSQAEANALATFDVRQTVKEQVSVVLVAAHGEIDTLRTIAQSALLGLSTSSAVSPLTYVQGTPVAAQGKTTYWRDVYEYQRVIRT
jgi:hypothetical protein